MVIALIASPLPADPVERGTPVASPTHVGPIGSWANQVFRAGFRGPVGREIVAFTAACSGLVILSGLGFGPAPQPGLSDGRAMGSVRNFLPLFGCERDPAGRSRPDGNWFTLRHPQTVSGAAANSGPLFAGLRSVS